MGATEPLTGMLQELPHEGVGEGRRQEAEESPGGIIADSLPSKRAPASHGAGDDSSDTGGVHPPSSRLFEYRRSAPEAPMVHGKPRLGREAACRAREEPRPDCARLNHCDANPERKQLPAQGVRIGLERALAHDVGAREGHGDPCRFR